MYVVYIHLTNKEKQKWAKKEKEVNTKPAFSKTVNIVDGGGCNCNSTSNLANLPSHSLTGSHAIQLGALDCAISTGYLSYYMQISLDKKKLECGVIIII